MYFTCLLFMEAQKSPINQSINLGRRMVQTLHKVIAPIIHCTSSQFSNRIVRLIVSGVDAIVLRLVSWTNDLDLIAH